MVSKTQHKHMLNNNTPAGVYVQYIGEQHRYKNSKENTKCEKACLKVDEKIIKLIHYILDNIHTNVSNQLIF